MKRKDLYSHLMIKQILTFVKMKLYKFKNMEKSEKI